MRNLLEVSWKALFHQEKWWKMTEAVIYKIGFLQWSKRRKKLLHAVKSLQDECPMYFQALCMCLLFLIYHALFIQKRVCRMNNWKNLKALLDQISTPTSMCSYFQQGDISKSLIIFLDCYSHP